MTTFNHDSVMQKDVTITDKGVRLGGILAVPHAATGLVIFAHGSGSSRYSPRNRSVARFLNEHGLATLLFDLLTDEESLDRSIVFDIGFLAGRLERVTEWARRQDEVKGLAVGYFGASTGSAAALAAASAESRIGAVVSRGGRPDLVEDRLALVQAPTLLIVGGDDPIVVDLNRVAANRLVRHELAIVPGASHLFEEPGTLEQVARLASQWFTKHLGATGRRAA